MAIETMGQFIAKLSEESSTEIYMGCIRRASDPAEWQEFVEAPFDHDAVLTLAYALRNEISYRISQGSTDDYCRMLQTEGHQLLRRFQRLASEAGAEISISQTDGALTPSEAMEVAGLVTIEDGKVRPTELCEQLAQEMEEELYEGGRDGANDAAD